MSSLPPPLPTHRIDQLRSALAEVNSETKGAHLITAEAFDFVGRLSLTHADIPDVTRIGLEWFAIEEWPDETEGDSDPLYAPVLAWHALGQLGGDGAIDALMEILAAAGAGNDEWAFEYLPEALARLGPNAVERLAAFMRDTSREAMYRGTAAHALTRIVHSHPEARDEVIAHMAAALRHDTEDAAGSAAFIGMVIMHLVELRAVEAAPDIKAAFDEDCVETFFTGPWEEVRATLGLTGPKDRRDDQAAAARSRTGSGGQGGGRYKKRRQRKSR